jgi:hypothetical protein
MISIVPMKSSLAFLILVSEAVTDGSVDQEAMAVLPLQQD